MIPRNPPPPRERLTTNDSVSSRTSFVRDGDAQHQLADLAVVSQTPDGLPALDRRPVQEYYSLFEDLLAESIDAQAPGFAEAVDSLIGWTEREESAKVQAIEKIWHQLDALKAENQQLNADLHDLMADNQAVQRQQEELARAREERDEYKRAVNDLERDVLDKLAENAELIQTIQQLKAQQEPNARAAGNRTNDLRPMPEEFKTAANFTEEAEQVEQLLRADIGYVNGGDEKLVGWSEAYQHIVNEEISECAAGAPWVRSGPLYLSGFSVLHIAALMGNGALVRARLSTGESCCVADVRGNTVLHHCLMVGPLRAAGLGFLGEEEEVAVIRTICEWLKEQGDLDALIRLLFVKNRSGLAFLDEHGEEELESANSGVRSQLEECLTHILTHRMRPTPHLAQYRQLLQRTGLGKRRGPEDGLFKLLVNLDQKKDNLLSYRVTRPELRFGDESQLSYSMLGCDQLGYGQQADVVSFLRPAAASVLRSGSSLLAADTTTAAAAAAADPLEGLAFSTVGSVVTVTPVIARETAQLVILGGSLFVYAHPAGLEAPVPLARMRRYALRRLTLLHLLEGYESMVLLRFAGAADLVLETPYKPHFVLALCVHYYNYCKPRFPVFPAAAVTAQAVPICVELNHLSAVPVFGPDCDTPDAVLVQTRFPHANVLGEVMAVSTRLPFAADRFLKPPQKVATVYYIPNINDWIVAPFVAAPPAICILNADMTLELYASPTDDSAKALYRIDLHPKRSLVTPIPLDSDRVATDPPAPAPMLTSGLFNRISKLLDLTQLNEKSWYAIEFQEDNTHPAAGAAAIGFEIKEERDEWLSFIHHRLTLIEDEE